MQSSDQDYSARQLVSFFDTRSEIFWRKRGEERALSLFHRAAQRVPAYKDFLKRYKVQPDKIKSFSDFQHIPPTNKKDYLRQYSLEELCWDGSLKKPLVFTSTSGSTSEPLYFPRDNKLDFQSSIYHEMFLRNDPTSAKKSTLVVICFGMGVWIGGTITFRAFQQIADRGYPISIIAPGINKKEIFEGLRRLGPRYDQVILCGYPPFIKDIIDEAGDYGVRWRKMKVKIVFAAEAFSEEFRSYIAKSIGIQNIYTDTMNIYGSADLGTMAEETPLSILIRRLSLRSKTLYQNLFNGAIHRMPTLVQFNPLFINFEDSKGKILCSGDNTVPLLRYDIGDQGSVYRFDEVVRKFRDSGQDLWKAIRYNKIQKTIAKLPFVYIYERSDFSTKLYGAIVFPEHIREALQEQRLLKVLTGKFTLMTKFDSHHNQFLEVNIELKPKVQPSKALKHLSQTLILKNLLKRSSEYKNNYNIIPEKVTPRIIFWPYEDYTYFKPGIKQSWVKK